MIAKLESSFALLDGIDRDWPRRFYDRLFRLHPGLRRMFPADMTEQRRKLRDTLQTVVAHLRDPAAARARLLELGRAHVGYGAKPEHYPLVIGAIVQAMAETAGERWSADLTAEWTSAMEMIGAIMLEGAAAKPTGGAR